MAHESTAWALVQKTGSASAKLVLVALADRARESNGWTCWPSVSDLCETTELNRKTVIAALAMLERLGLIVDTGEKVGRTHQIPVYRLNLEQSQIRNSSERGTVPDFPGNSPVFSSKQSQKRDTEPVMEPVKEPVITPPTPQGVGEDFAAFWAAYPKKFGKGHAMKSWAKAKPPLDAVLVALSWQTESEGWTKENGKFIPYPATWINARRWEDEPPAKTKPPHRQMSTREAKRAAIYGRTPTTGNVIEGDFTRDECATTPTSGRAGPSPF